MGGRALPRHWQPGEHAVSFEQLCGIALITLVVGLISVLKTHVKTGVTV